MTNQNRKPLPFEEQREISNKKNLKLSGRSSRFQKEVIQRKEAEAAKETFDKRASEYMENRQEQQAQGVEVAKKLIGMLRDKTLPQNKGVLSISEEQEIRQEFNILTNSLNNDQTQPEGHGSLTAIALIIKVLFEMRDRMNLLEYQLEMEKKKNMSSPATGEAPKDV